MLTPLSRSLLCSLALLAGPACDVPDASPDAAITPRKGPPPTRCDPLAPACPSGRMCAYIGGQFTCVPDASGVEGQFLDPCEYIDACDPGLACIDGTYLSDCETIACCTRYCDLDLAQCPSGYSCLPWYEPWQVPPPGEEDIGVCADVLPY